MPGEEEEGAHQRVLPRIGAIGSSKSRQLAPFLPQSSQVIGIRDAHLLL